jgi:hypothetical protein
MLTFFLRKLAVITRNYVRKLISVPCRKLRPSLTKCFLLLDEVWRLAGPRISGFCRGFLTSLLQELRPQFRTGITNNALRDQPALWLSDLQYGDALLQRVKGRAKRQTTYTTRGYGRRHRGQTQTQYLAFQNGGNAGKAEAESSPDLSRTHVSK